MNTAATVTGVPAGGAPPPARGGTIVEGLYESTVYEVYGDGAIGTRRITLEVRDSGAQILWVVDQEIEGEGIVEIHLDTSVAIAGPGLSITTTCASFPDASIASSLEYTSTDESLITYYVLDSSTYATTYTRLP
jgi:hypothetical protein